MKKSTLLIAGLVLLLGIFLTVQAGEDKKENSEVTYVSYDEGLKKAKQDSLHLVIMFETSWCGWCKKMDKETMTDPKVVELLNDHFVVAKVDGDKRRDLTKAYGVRGYPATWFLKHDGTRIAPINGFWPASDFAMLLEYISEYAYEKIQYQEWVKKHQDKG